ncbi:hypothetical protein KJ762_09530 [bacterium]|nr:hypothetical protein [bacterium]
MHLNRRPNHRFSPVRWISGILLVCTGLLFARTNTGSSFYIKNEITTESNIFEDSTSTRSIGNQLWFGLSHNYRSKQQNLRLNLVSNLSHYTRHSIESKAVSMLAVQHDYNLFSAFSLHSTIDIFNKQWYQANNGYTSSRINSGINYSLKKTSTLIGGEYQYNRFPSFNYFTSDYSGLFLQVNHRYSDKNILSIKTTWHSIRYSDRLITFSENSDSIGLPYQNDELLTLQVGTEIRRKNIYGVYFRYMINTSNNPTASFHAASCRLFSSQKILGVYTQIIIELQLKEYSENPVQPLIFTNPDPEQNIQNQLLFGWDKPLSPHFSLQGKLAYFKNETVYSDQFYDKWFVSIGILYRIP